MCAGDLIGYYLKTQPVPKPIYRHSRIVLEVDDKTLPSEAFERFINANKVYPHIITTQCPLLEYPAGFANTLVDTMHMVAQNNVSHWIQLGTGLANAVPRVAITRNRSSRRGPRLRP